MKSPLSHIRRERARLVAVYAAQGLPVPPEIAALLGIAPSTNHATASPSPDPRSAA